MRTLFFIFFIASFFQAHAQGDTLRIDGTMVNTSVLQPGAHRWLVYSKRGKDSARTGLQLWTRTIQKLNYQGRPAISVSQRWDNNDTVIHTVTTICEEKTFATLSHKTWNRGLGTTAFDFITKEAFFQDVPVRASDTGKIRQRIWSGFKEAINSPYFLNWHLDLEVFSTLPYKAKRTFLIPFYHPGSVPPQYVAYTVTGSAMLKINAGVEIDCWLLEHHPVAGANEIFWISKKTREVLRLVQEFKGNYRYKVKLPFSE